MAIFRSTIFDNVRRKLANTVMFRRYSKGIMRSNPGTIRNPRTPEQLVQRAKMSLLVDLARRMAPVINVGFKAPYHWTSPGHSYYCGCGNRSSDMASNHPPAFSLFCSTLSLPQRYWFFGPRSITITAKSRRRKLANTNSGCNLPLCPRLLF